MTRRTQHPRESSCFGFWLLGSCLCLVMLLVVAVADAGEFKGSIKVGVPLPLTGRHAPFGEIIKNSFVMAVDEVNAKGGVRGGYKLDLLFEGKDLTRLGRVSAFDLVLEIANALT